MIHVGDITKLSGYTLPVVDIITGGSPCQDLSVAGKRAGLDGERSGLFMEQIRIVKEMRERDRRTGRTGWLVRPRFMVWENVPGAFSSNKGKDFQAVLTEIVKIVEPDAPNVPLPDKGKWSHSGCLYDELGRWSVAWRLHDAQFWGVPQRRKRIALVADFGGLAAPEILFEREGLSGYSEPGEAERKGTAGSSGGGSEKTISFQERAEKPGGGKGILIQNERVGALSTLNNQNVFCLNDQGGSVMAFAQNQRDEVRDLNDVAGALSAEPGMKQQTFICLNDQGGSVMAFAQNQVGEVRVSHMSGTLNTNSNASGRNSPLVYDARGNGDGEVAPTMTGDHQNRVTDYTALCVGNGQLNQMSVVYDDWYIDTTHADDVVRMNDTAAPLQARDHKGGKLVFDARVLVGGEIAPTMTGDHQNRVTDYTAIVNTYQDVTGTLNPDAHPGSYNGQDAYNDMLIARSTANAIVRRLTPLECERLQGFPDGWTDIGEWVDSKGKKHRPADSPRYKTLGNSIALPFWAWMARRICAQYERPMTTGSLFDGIGGFPLVFERAGAKAVWASEIEEFPIAVTKRHFPEGESS